MGLILARVILSGAKQSRTFAACHKSASAWHEAGSRALDNSEYRRSRAARALLWSGSTAKTSHRDVFFAQDDTEWGRRFHAKQGLFLTKTRISAVGEDIILPKMIKY